MSHSKILSSLLSSYRKALKETQLETDGAIDDLISRYKQKQNLQTLVASNTDPTLTSIPPTGYNLTNDEDFIAIIGGGLAGLNAAYQFKKQHIAFKIFEADDRVGGRVSTQKDFSHGHTTDLGGEFVDTTHTDLLELVKEFEIDMIDTQVETLPRNIYFYHGRIYSEEEVVIEYKKILPQIMRDYHTLDENYSNEASIKLDNTPLSEYFKSLGADEWFNAILEKAYTSEYGRETSEQSTINFLNMLLQEAGKTFEMYGVSDELLKIKGGSSRLIEELEKRTQENILLAHKLTRISQTDDRYTLHFDNGKEYTAKYILITLPYTVLRKVVLDVNDMSENKQKCINELGYGTNVKLIQKFDTKIWRTHHNQGYLLSDFIHNGFDSSQLQNESQHHGTYTFFFGGDQAIELCDKNQQEKLKEAYIAYLDTVFPGAKESATIQSNENPSFTVTDWPNNPLCCGSYSCFKPGQWTGIAKYVNEPVGNIYFAGEHCSKDFQGFMNGALQSSNKTVQAIIKARSNEKVLSY